MRLRLLTGGIIKNLWTLPKTARFPKLSWGDISLDMNDLIGDREAVARQHSAFSSVPSWLYGLGKLSFPLWASVFPGVNLVEGNAREECWCLLCESKFGKEKRNPTSLFPGVFPVVKSNRLDSQSLVVSSIRQTGWAAWLFRLLAGWPGG